MHISQYLVLWFATLVLLREQIYMICRLRIDLYSHKKACRLFTWQAFPFNSQAKKTAVIFVNFCSIFCSYRLLTNRNRSRFDIPWDKNLIHIFLLFFGLYFSVSPEQSHTRHSCQLNLEFLKSNFGQFWWSENVVVISCSAYVMILRCLLLKTYHFLSLCFILVITRNELEPRVVGNCYKRTVSVVITLTLRCKQFASHFKVFFSTLVLIPLVSS